MIDVNITFPREDMEAYREQMNRLVTLMGKEPKEAVRMATLALLKALAASTRKAPKTARIRKDTIRRINLRTGKVSSRTVQYSYLVERYDRKTGTMRNILLPATSLEEAKSARVAQIRYAGLAKASWGWSAQRLFPTSVRYDGRKPVRQTYSVTQRGEGNGFSVTVSNDLDYISKALGGGRGPAVSSAMARAAVTLKNRIDRRLKGALK